MPLTYHTPDVESAGRDRPDAEEIEIAVTPEMIKAGLTAYLDHDPNFYSLEEIICKVYLAIEKARIAARACPD